MARAFHDIVKTCSLDLRFDGEEFFFDIPYEDCPDLMDEDAMVKWCQKHGTLLGYIHKGIQKDMIDRRATGKPTVKADGSYKSLSEDKENAAKRIYELAVVPVNPPGQTKVNKADWNALTGSMQPLIDMLNYSVDDCIKQFNGKFKESLIRQVYNHLTS